MNLTGNQLELLQEKLAKIAVEKSNSVSAWYAVRLALPTTIEHKNDIANDLLHYLETAMQIADVSMSILFSEDKS